MARNLMPKPNTILTSDDALFVEEIIPQIIEIVEKLNSFIQIPLDKVLMATKKKLANALWYIIILDNGTVIKILKGKTIKDSKIIITTLSDEQYIEIP